MTPIFADTSFFIAFLNVEDQAYGDAYKYMSRSDISLVTSEWVLLELGNYLSRRAGRSSLKPLVNGVAADRRFRIVVAEHDDFDDGLKLHNRRPDKHWSMTDCISFNLMEREGLTDALTSDHHFEQAGFRILLGNSAN